MKSSNALSYNVIYTILLILGLTININFVYIIFFILTIKTLKSGKINLTSMAVLMLYSIILPSNYISIFFVILFGIFFVLNKKKFDKLLFGLLFIATISSLLSDTPIINIIFALIYYSSFLILVSFINENPFIDIKKIHSAMNDILFLEFMATIINFVKFDFPFNVYLDWSSGTLGTGQQAQLCLIGLFGCVFYTYIYKTEKNTLNCLLKIFMWLIIIVSTNCWLMYVVACLGIGITFIPSLKKKELKKFFVIIIFFVVGIIAVPKILPDSIWNQVYGMMTDLQYRNYRFAKLKVYENTFITIPQNDVKFLLFGNGVGYYSSRAALTCTGKYIHDYLLYFSQSISHYTEIYIYPQLVNTFDYGGSDYGSVLYRPYSSIISIMGETGILGIIMVLIIFVKLCHHKTKYTQISFMILLSMCFIENYLEYAKPLIVLFLSVYVFENYCCMDEGGKDDQTD